jgi:AcrR family transcriptional regulator
MIQMLQKTKIIRNRQHTRARLLQAAVDLAADGGSRGVSMKAAARRANLSRGVAYQHFKDRDHMLSEAKRWISDRLADGVKTIGVVPLAERVRDSALVMLNNPEAAKLLIADALTEGGRAHRRLFDMVLKSLNQFKASGVVRADVDAEVFTYISLASNVAALILHYARKKDRVEVTADRFAKEWVALLRKGLFSDQVGRRRSAPRRGSRGRTATARRRSGT